MAAGSPAIAGGVLADSRGRRGALTAPSELISRSFTASGTKPAGRASFRLGETTAETASWATGDVAAERDVVIAGPAVAA